jgi:hypothetical protein
LLFDLIQVRDESYDAGGVSFSGVEGFGEAATDVGHAAAEVDEVAVVFLIAGVDAVAVGLPGAGPFSKVVAKGAFEVLTATALLPAVADAAFRAGVIEDPDVAGAGFSGAGGEFFDGGFVKLEVAFSEALIVDGLGDGPEEFEAFEVPVVQGVARGVEAEALENGLLPVDGKVVGVLRDDEFGGEAEGGDAAGERGGGCGGDEGWPGAVILAAEFGTDGATFGDFGRGVVELFGDFLADEFELVFVLFVVFGEDCFFDDFEGVPALEAAVVFTLGFRSGLFSGVPLRFLVVVSRGGPGLFRLESFDEELELGGVDLFAFGTVEELDEGVDFLTQ